MKKIKNIVFDYDGVILNSVEIKNDAFKEVVKNYDYQVKKKFVKFHLENLGVSRYKKFEFLVNILLKEKSNSNYEKILKKFENILKRGLKKGTLINGIRSFLIRNKDLNLFISSGTPENELKKNCKQKRITNYFIEILGSPKTKKQHILYLKKKYKINKNNTLFFGDSFTDYDVANKYKLNFIQVGNNLKNIKIKLKIKDFNDKRLVNISKFFN